jgi:hypothetical protein
MQGVASCLDDVARCIEIGFADLQMNNVAALRLERFRFHQHFECGLRTKSRHAPGEPEFMCLMHDMKPALYRTGATCLLQPDWHEAAICDSAM